MTTSDIFDILTIKERYDIIRQLEQDYDPGTFQDLDTLSLTELRALVANLQEALQ